MYTGKTKVHSGEFRDEFRESTSKKEIIYSHVIAYKHTFMYMYLHPVGLHCMISFITGSRTKRWMRRTGLAEEGCPPPDDCTRQSLWEPLSMK